MAEKHNYKLVGTGTTTRDADRDLRSKAKDLTGKLKKCGADTTLVVVRTDYKGVYIQKPGTIVDGPSSFTTESEEGWKGWGDVRTKAAEKTKNLRKYSANYTVDQYLRLTDAQLDTTTRTQPPAGPYSRSSSSLDKLANW